MKYPLLIIVTAMLAAAIAAKPADVNSPQLRYVVIISRHGMRTPIFGMRRVGHYLAPAAPNVSLPPGYLTPQGRAAIELMGAYYREWLSSERLISESACQDADRICIWADTYERTLESGSAFSASLLPGCGVKVHSVVGGKRDPLFARGRASDLLQHVLLSMEQAEEQKIVPGALDDPGDRALILVGHDTNLAEISSVLHLRWHLYGYHKNGTPPGGALIFSLWRGTGTTGDFVRTQFIAQSLNQLRNLVPLSLTSPPESEDLLVPRCDSVDPRGGCSWPVFEAALKRAIRQ